METAAIPSTPEWQVPVSPRYSPATDGLISSRKAKAINAIRSIVGFFHKPTKRKNEKRDPLVPLTPPVTGDSKFNYDMSCFSTSSPDSTDKSGSENGAKDGSQLKLWNDTRGIDTEMSNARRNDDVGDGLSKIGNYDDEEFHVPRQDGECDEATDDSDVFLDESYFEDDYFEDFSGDSSAEENVPLFTPMKETYHSAGTCACIKNRETQLTETNNRLDISRVRHKSMPCLTDLASSTESLDLQNKVEQILQIPTTYFTLGTDMVTNHFAYVDPSKDKSIKHCTIESTLDNSPVAKLGVSFTKSLKVNGNPESYTTPIRQIYSISGEHQTPTTPYKRRFGEPVQEIQPRSNPVSSNKRGLKSRKSLYTDAGQCSLESEDLDDNRRNKTIADGLSIVADWILHVVAINRSNKERNAAIDTGIDTEIELPVGEKLLKLSKKKNLSTARKAPKMWRMRFDKPPDLLTIVPTASRPRLESGYSSGSRCSTPATPLSEPCTPMNELKRGCLMSPRSLNKLDGLVPKQAITLQGKRSQTFFLPATQNSHVLESVPELSESSQSSELEKSFPSSAGIHDTSDVILSGGGDVESLKTSSGHSSSESAFWSTFSAVSHHQHLNVSVNIIDENNNIVQPALPFLPAGLPEISSPAMKHLQPISTSSPLQVIASNKPIPRLGNDLEINISNKQDSSIAVATKCDPQGGDVLKQQMAPHTNDNEMKFEKKRKSASSRSARTCLRFEERNGNHHDKMPGNKPSEDYIILKRVAKFIVGLIPSKIKLKSHAFIPALMGNLKENYHRIMSQNEVYEGVRGVFQLKVAVEQNVPAPNTITIQNSVDQFLLNALIQRRKEAIFCSDFVFQNISNVLRENVTFLSLAPELVVVLLSNDHCIVKGPNGFPLPYRAAEKEVLKAVVKFLERHHWKNPQSARSTRRVLYQLADISVLKDAFHLLATAEADNATRHLPKPALMRAKHKISYRMSQCPTVSSSKGNSPHFSPVEIRHPPGRAPDCSLASHEDRMTFFQLTGEGTSTSKTPADVSMICDEEHFLRTLYFCYHSVNGVPYLVDLGMQYIAKGKKKTMFITSSSTCHNEAVQPATDGPFKGTEGSKRQSGSHIDNVVSAEGPNHPCQTSTRHASQPPVAGPWKKVAIVLTPGEHITAVSVLGSSEVHNLEVTTNYGRRVRAHGMADVSGTEWTRIPAAPEEDGPTFCLHALIGEIRTEPTRLCNVGALWALTSWQAANELNGLDR